MCSSRNLPYLQVTMPLIIVSNFALNHQVDYYRLEVLHLKLKPTLRQRGNFTFHHYQYVPCTFRAIETSTVTLVTTVAFVAY